MIPASLNPKKQYACATAPNRRGGFGKRFMLLNLPHLISPIRLRSIFMKLFLVCVCVCCCLWRRIGNDCIYVRFLY